MCLSARSRARLPRQDRSSCSPGVGKGGEACGKQRTQAAGQALQWFRRLLSTWDGTTTTSGEDFRIQLHLQKNWSSQRGTLVASRKAGSLAGDASEMPHAQSGEGDAVFPRRRGPKTSTGAMDRAVLDEQVPPRGWYMLRRVSASMDPTVPGQQTHGARRLELRVHASSMQHQEMRNRARDVMERNFFRCHHTSDSTPPPRRWGPGWAPNHWNVPELARRCAFLAHPSSTVEGTQ